MRLKPRFLIALRDSPVAIRVKFACANPDSRDFAPGARHGGAQRKAAKVDGNVRNSNGNVRTEPSKDVRGLRAAGTVQN